MFARGLTGFDPLELPVQVALADAEDARGILAVALAVIEHAPGVAQLDLVQVRPLALTGLRLERGRHAQPHREMLGADATVVAQDQRALDHVLEFAHVAGPRVTHEYFHRFRRHLGAALRYHTRSADEVIHQSPDVATALAQRRDHQRHDREPEAQVLAELLLLDHRLQRTIGRGDHPHVHRDVGVATDAAEGMVLQHPQQAHLERGGEFADLVEEDGAAVRDLEQTALE